MRRGLARARERGRNFAYNVLIGTAAPSVARRRTQYHRCGGGRRSGTGGEICPSTSDYELP